MFRPTQLIHAHADEPVPERLLNKWVAAKDFHRTADGTSSLGSRLRGRKEERNFAQHEATMAPHGSTDAR